MSTETVALVAAWVAFAALVAWPVVVLYRTRDRRLDEDLVEARIRELQALPSPGELGAAPDLPKAAQRRLRGRAHPLARKHRDGSWR